MGLGRSSPQEFCHWGTWGASDSSVVRLDLAKYRGIED